MQRFKNLNEMFQAFDRKEIPQNVVSPGYACAILGISRQAMHQLCKRGTIPAWCAERYIFIDLDAVQAYSLKKRGIPDTQGELLNA